MRNRVLPLVFTIVIGGFLANSFAVLHAQDPDAKGTKITLSTGSAKPLAINGKELAFPVEREKLIESLGKPTRTKEMFGFTTIEWEAHGLSAVERDKSISQFTIILEPSKEFDKKGNTLPLWKGNRFQGTLEVDGKKFKGGRTINDMETVFQDKDVVVKGFDVVGKGGFQSGGLGDVDGFRLWRKQYDYIEVVLDQYQYSSQPPEKAQVRTISIVAKVSEEKVKSVQAEIESLERQLKAKREELEHIKAKKK
jgi:hypothetical protein